MNNFLNSFTGFTKFMIIFWSLAIFSLVGFICYTSVQFGTGLWLIRPVDIVHQSTYTKNNILYRDVDHVIIK